MQPPTPSRKAPRRRQIETDAEPSALNIKKDVDYISIFCKLTDVNLLIEQRGATKDRLMRRSTLHYALGHFERSAQDAAGLLDIDPDDGEGYFRMAAASLAFAVQQLEKPPSRPGSQAEDRRPTAWEHLVIALVSFRKACALNPDDEEARHALQTTAWMLEALPDMG